MSNRQPAPAPAGVLHAWAMARDRERQRAELAALDERTLRDLALGRSELGSCVEEAQGRAESTRLRIAVEQALQRRAAPPRPVPSMWRAAWPIAVVAAALAVCWQPSSTDTPRTAWSAGIPAPVDAEAATVVETPLRYSAAAERARQEDLPAQF